MKRLLGLTLVLLGAATGGNTLAESAPPAPLETSPRRVRIALFAEPALGVSGGSFYNQLIGARLDYRFTDRLSLGAALSYANLKGQYGRAHDVLPAWGLEYRAPLGTSGTWGLPLRWSTGYLPGNGPVVRASLGVSYAVSSHVDLVLDALAPTVWIIRNRTVASLGAALEVSYSP